MSRSWLRSAALVPIVALAAVLSIVLGVRAIAPLGQGLLLFGMVVLFAIPGVLAAFLIFAAGPGRSLAAWSLGPVWGYGISSVVLLALWAADLRGAALLVTPLLASVLAAASAACVRGCAVARPARRADLVAILILMALVPALVGRPFARVGAAVPDGRAYRAYFTADTVWRMAVVAELSKGEFPPRNPFYRGDRMHYYWLAHLLPAGEYQFLQKRVSIEQVLLTHSLALGVAFVIFFFGFVRQWVDSTGAAFAACVVTLLGSSFEGTERLLLFWRQGTPLAAIDTLNIDAVTRWFYGSLPVDGLQRLLWYQPHHSTGYALGLSAVLVAARAGDALSPRVMMLCGTLLGLCLLLSSFAAIMLTVMVAAVVALRAVSERAWLRMVPAAVAGATPLVAATAVALWLHYVDRSGSSLVRVFPNPQAFEHAAIALVLSFGPLLVGAIAGAILAIRRHGRQFMPIAAIVGISFLFYFFVDLRDHQYVYVGWRAGHLLFISFAVLTGYALQEMAAARPAVRRAWTAAAIVLVMLSVPTFAIDFYNTQDISNRKQAAGFPWTLVLTHDELEMFRWIKAYTRPNALVQVEPFSRDPSTWAYVPAFAERRMFAGLPISMVPIQKYQVASAEVRELYRERDPQAAYDRAARLGIDYLIVGAPERQAYPGFETMLQASPALFRPVFQSMNASLYTLEGAR